MQYSSDNVTKKTLSKEEEEEGSRLNVVASSEMANVLLKEPLIIDISLYE